MMRAIATALLGASAASAAYLVNELSFGYSGHVSPNDDGHIPNFRLDGNPNYPEILSNKVILTPVAPGNQRGAVWGERQLRHKEWVTDIDFRANGPERGGGNFNVWLVRGGPESIGSSSIYTVGKFDGLAIVVDQHGGSGGMIRGFLNDGNTDYSKLHGVDDKAFGHCIYAYRNRGQPSQLKLHHSQNGLKVEIDGRLCFASENVSLPEGYQWGVTAATQDNPDSFEVFKLMVMSLHLHDDHPFAQDHSTYHDAAQGGQHEEHHDGHDDHAHHEEHHDENWSHDQKPVPGQPPHVVYGRGGFKTSDHWEAPVADDPYEAEIPDEKAERITSSKAQFEDLHNRLMSLNHHISSIFKQTTSINLHAEHYHAEVATMLDRSREEILRRLDGLDEQRRRIEALEREVKGLRAELAGQVRNSENTIKTLMGEHHSTLAGNIERATPGHGRLIFVVIGSQLLLVAGYIAYKRRKNALPKKYL